MQRRRSDDDDLLNSSDPWIEELDQGRHTLNSLHGDVADVPAAFAAEPAVRLHSPVQPGACRPSACWPGWRHEVKHDGYRILARKQGFRVQRCRPSYAEAALRQLR
jgi:hypothetical protein